MTASCVTCGHTLHPLGLSDREMQVLERMAEGRSNVGIAHALWITEGTVEKHVRSVMAKLQVSADVDDHRRVLAVLALLRWREDTSRLEELVGEAS